MRLKDRLNKNKIVNNISTETDEKKKNQFFISDIFNDSKELRKYIVQLAQSKRNIILVSNKSFDKLIIAEYIKSQLRKTNARIIGDIDEKANDLNGRINIIPSPDIQMIVKIMEQIIYGCRSFIFGINLGTYDNFINKLKVLIALSHKNLTPVDITTLIEAMNAVVVYISKNEDGLFFISKIDEIKIDKLKNELELNQLFGFEEEQPYIGEEPTQDYDIGLSNKKEDDLNEPYIQEENIDNEQETTEEQYIEQEESKNIETDSGSVPKEIKEEENVHEELELFEELANNTEELALQQIEEVSEPVENNISVSQEEQTYGSEEPAQSCGIGLDIQTEETNKKLNKYQMLKERARKRKLELQND